MNPNIVAHLISLLIFAVIQFAFLPITAAYVWFAYLGVGFVASILSDKQITKFQRNSTPTSTVIGWASTAAVAACIWNTTTFGLVYVLIIISAEILIRLWNT